MMIFNSGLLFGPLCIQIAHLERENVNIAQNCVSEN